MDALSAIAKSASDEAVEPLAIPAWSAWLARNGEVAESQRLFMRRSSLKLALVLAALWSAPALAQSRAQLGPLCTSEGTPVDAQVDACNKIIALKGILRGKTGDNLF